MDRESVKQILRTCMITAPNFYCNSIDLYTEVRYNFQTPAASAFQFSDWIENLSDRDLAALLFFFSGNQITRPVCHARLRLMEDEPVIKECYQCFFEKSGALLEYFLKGISRIKYNVYNKNFRALYGDCEKRFSRTLLDINEDELRELLRNYWYYDTISDLIFISKEMVDVYSQWGIVNPLTDISKVKYNQISIRDTVARKIIRGPEALYQLLQLDQKDERVQIIVGKQRLALAWIGYSVKEMLELEDDEVDLKNRTVRGIKIPDAVNQILLDCKQIPYVVRPGGVCDFIYHQEAAGTKFVRLMTKDSAGPKTKLSAMYVNTAGKYLRKAISEIKEIDEDILIPENVKRSGILYRMCEREKERGSLSSDDIYELAGVSRSISVGNQKLDHWRMLYQDYKAIQ